MEGKLGAAVRLMVTVVTVTGALWSISRPASAVAVSSTAVVSSVNPSIFGEGVTLTATVTCPAFTPTGTATFFDGTMTLGGAALDAGGQAAFTTSALAVGTHAITAAYSGDPDCEPSTSTAFDQVVDQASTTTTVVSSVTPTVFGEVVTSTATVAAVLPGAGTPTGTVSFFDGVTPLGTVALDVAAQATFMTSELTVGSHSVTAAYPADVSFSASTSGAVTQVVDQAGTTTTVVSWVNPSVFGQSTAFTATVAAVLPGAGTPTGAVSFFDGATPLGAAALDLSGQATFTTSALAVGRHAITAAYVGNASFVASTSGAVTQVVDRAGTTTTVVSWVNPSVFGQSTAFTATVAAVLPGAGMPTGSVTFRDGATPLGAATLDLTGRATLTTSTLAPGSHSITAAHGGSSSFAAGTSAALAQTVIAAAATTTLDTSINPSAFGQAVTFTATITGNGAMPTGTVTFLDGVASVGAATLDGSGRGSLTVSTLTSGAHEITAFYGGDVTYPPSATASSLNEEVAASAVLDGVAVAAAGGTGGTRGTGGTMARTGANTEVTTAFGLGLLTVGMLAISGSRRRRGGVHSA